MVSEHDSTGKRRRSRISLSRQTIASHLLTGLAGFTVAYLWHIFCNDTNFCGYRGSADGDHAQGRPRDFSQSKEDGHQFLMQTTTSHEPSKIFAPGGSPEVFHNEHTESLRLPVQPPDQDHSRTKHLALGTETLHNCSGFEMDNILIRYLRRDLLAYPHPKILAPPCTKTKKSACVRKCPCCGNTKVWLPWGRGERRQSHPRCGKCGSVERHRMLCLYLNRNTDYFSSKNKNVLEFTPFSRVLEHDHYYTAADFDPGSYGTGDKTKAVKLSITDMNTVADNTFDYIFVSMILEHIIEEERAVKEVLRVLKPGKHAYFAVPIDYRRERTIEETYKGVPGEAPMLTNSARQKELYGQKDHVRLYGRDVVSRWQTYGCEVIIIDASEVFSKEDFQTFAMDLYELNMFFCKK